MHFLRCHQSSHWMIEFAKYCFFFQIIIMSDEIDDLSFPNAVLTRLMNEAVGFLTMQFSQSLFTVRRISNNLKRSSSSDVSCCIGLHPLHQYYVCRRIHFINRTFFISSANQYATNAKRKTVAVQDIFKALQSNQFEMLVEPLQESLKGKREVEPSAE